MLGILKRSMTELARKSLGIEAYVGQDEVRYHRTVTIKSPKEKGV